MAKKENKMAKSVSKSTGMTIRPGREYLAAMIIFLGVMHQLVLDDTGRVFLDNIVSGASYEDRLALSAPLSGSIVFTSLFLLYDRNSFDLFIAFACAGWFAYKVLQYT